MRMTDKEIVHHLALSIMATENESTEPFGQWKARIHNEILSILYQEDPEMLSEEQYDEGKHRIAMATIESYR